MIYTIYGNCQADALAQVLNTNIEFSNKYRYVGIKAVHQMTSDDIKYLHKNLFPNLDLFIFLPIINFDKEFTTDYILSVLNKNTIVIYFQNIYSNIYFPQFKKFKGEYHDVNFNTSRVYSTEFLNENLEKNIKALKDRELFHDRIDKKVLIYDFIRENYNKKCLFYTIDHGSKHIYAYIAKEILKYLNFNPDVLDIDPQKDFMLPMYKSVIDWCGVKTIEHNIFKDYSKDINKRCKIIGNTDIPSCEENFEKIVYISEELDIKNLYLAISLKIKYKVPIIAIFNNEYIKIKDNIFEEYYFVIKNEDIISIINKDHTYKPFKLIDDIYNLILNNEKIADNIENVFLNTNNTEYRYGILESLNVALFKNIYYFLTN